jgi:hypothetical protein
MTRSVIIRAVRFPSTDNQIVAWLDDNEKIIDIFADRQDGLGLFLIIQRRVPTTAPAGPEAPSP